MLHTTGAEALGKGYHVIQTVLLLSLYPPLSRTSEQVALAQFPVGLRLQEGNK